MCQDAPPKLVICSLVIFVIRRLFGQRRVCGRRLTIVGRRVGAQYRGALDLAWQTSIQSSEPPTNSQDQHNGHKSPELPRLLLLSELIGEVTLRSRRQRRYLRQRGAEGQIDFCLCIYCPTIGVQNRAQVSFSQLEPG